MRTALGSMLVATFFASTLHAQGTSGVVQPGAVIRAERAGSEDRLVGTLVSRTPDTLTVALRSGGMVKIPSSTVRGIEISSGRRRLAPAAKWAAIGAGIWGPLAAILPYEACDPARFSNCDSSNSMSKSEFVITQAVGMAIITGAVGAIRGNERWTRVEGSTASAFVRPSRGITAVGLRLGF